MSNFEQVVLADIAAGRKATFATAEAYYKDLSLRAEVSITYAASKYLRIEKKVKHTITSAVKEATPVDHHTLLETLRRLKGQFISIQDLAIEAKATPDDIEALVSVITAQGFNVQWKEGMISLGGDIPKAPPTVISVSGQSKQTFRVGLVSDNHLASRYARMDVLNSLYDYFQEHGITTVYNCGNWIEGDARFNKHDVIVHGLEGQIRYFIENYPQREGITNYLITGDDHEGWYTQREGIDVGAYMQMRAEQAGRQDLKYLGHMEHDIIMKAEKGETVLRLQHPGGGSAYAISYTPQKIVESLQGGEKPHILFIGHYHKASYNSIRGVHVVQAGCTQDQSPFMRKKRLAAHLGGWIIEWSVDEVGAITRFKTEWIPFYNRDFYKNKWSYQWQHQEIG